MREPPENPDSLPALGGTDATGDTPILPYSSRQRIASGIVSIVVGIFAFAAYIAWAIADSYFISDQDHFRLVLAVCVFLLIVAGYWMFFALIGYKLVPKRINYAILGLSFLATVPACIFVCMFFL